MANRKQLPLPDGIAPSRRPVPALPDNDDSPPPPVPSRPRPGKGLPPVPSPSTLPPRQVPRPAPEPEPEPDDQGVYEDGEVGDIYDEAHMGGAEEDEQETYDDMEVGEATDEPQESYDEFGGVAQEPQESYDEFGGIAQDTYEIEEAQEEYQECDVGPAVTEELYQVTDDEPQQTSTKPLPPPPSAPALPPPRPRQREKEDVAVPPPPRDTAAKKQAVVKGQGMPAIGMGDIQNIKNQLKKVGVAPKPQPKTEPKVYTDSSELKQKFNFFKQKEQEDDSNGSDIERQEPVLKPRINKPAPPKPSREIPRVPLKPVVKENNVKKPVIQVNTVKKENDEEKPDMSSFLSQVKLKHVSRPGDTAGQNSSSVNLPVKPSVPKREPSPTNRPEQTRAALKPTEQSKFGGTNIGHSLPANRPPARNAPVLTDKNKPNLKPPTIPIPVPRPEERKSFLHAFLEKNPEFSTQKLTSKLNTSDSLPPLPSPRDDNLPPPPPPAKSETSPQQRDLPPPPVSTPPQPPPPRGKDGYTKVNVNEEQNNTHNEESDDEPQDIYDDAISFEDPLSRESWYFGEIDRMVGNEKLKKLNQNGAYLLRKSTKGGDKQPYTLMVIYKGHVYNLKIRERNDGRVALGEDKPDEMSFKSVADLIKHHQNNDVILVHRDGKQDSTLLLKSPPK